MTAKEFHISKYGISKKDFERLIELGQIKEVDYNLMEEYHEAKLLSNIVNQRK